jgi:hypothetical protein
MGPLAEPASELPGEDVAPVDDALSVASRVSVEDGGDESVVAEAESVGSAPAGVFATATPMPSATANAPTRPRYMPSAP